LAPTAGALPSPSTLFSIWEHVLQKLLLSSLTAALLLLSGCNGAKSPETVAADTAKAEQKADKEMNSAENSVSKDLNKAAGNVDDELADFNNQAAKDAYKLAVTQADGDRKVALAKCEALGGDAQKACKDQADADYKATKASAKASALSLKQ
jgi:hypothetical protein